MLASQKLSFLHVSFRCTISPELLLEARQAGKWQTGTQQPTMERQIQESQINPIFQEEQEILM